MVKNLFGNYLGLVIDNNDPEFRGRAQIWIPHISGTIKDLNVSNLNFSVQGVGKNIIGGIPDSVLQTLKKQLPWAESASPIVGTSGSGTIDSDGNIVPPPTSSSSNSSVSSAAAGAAIASTAASASTPILSKQNNIAAVYMVNSILKESIGIDLGASSVDDVLTKIKTDTTNWELIYDSNKNFDSTNVPIGSIVIIPEKSYIGITTKPSGSGLYTTIEDKWQSGSISSIKQIVEQDGKIYNVYVFKFIGTNSFATKSYAANSSGSVNSSDYLIDNVASPSNILEKLRKNQSSNADQGDRLNLATQQERFKFCRETANREGIKDPNLYASFLLAKSRNLTSATTEAYNNPGEETSNDPLFGRGNIPNMNIAARQVEDTILVPGETNKYYLVYKTLTASFKDHAKQYGKHYVEKNPKKSLENLKVPLKLTDDFISKILEIYANFATMPGTGSITSDELATLGITSVTTKKASDSSGPTISVNSNDSPGGNFSIPSVGSMLWVFFREGNPLFPVYFAASYSADEWKAAYAGTNPANPAYSAEKQPINNIPKEEQKTGQSSAIKIGPDSGIKVSYTQNSKDSTGSTKQSITSFYGNGSTFSFSNAGIQQHTDSNYKSTTQGNFFQNIDGSKEEHIKQTSNLIINGNSFRIVGVLNSSVLAAMDEIQQISSDINKLLIT